MPLLKSIIIFHISVKLEVSFFCSPLKKSIIIIIDFKKKMGFLCGFLVLSILFPFFDFDEFTVLREACEVALEQKYFLDHSELEGFIDEADIAHRKQLKAVRSVFEKVADADAPSEVSMMVAAIFSFFIVVT